MDPDELLITRWRSGNAEAARTLVQRHYPRMFKLLYRLSGTRDQAEELTQELFARLTRRVSVSDKEVSNLQAWLYRAALNLWRDWVRREIYAREKGIKGSNADIQDVPAPDAVEPAALERWLRDAVRAAILELDPQYREVLVLCYYQGLTSAEVAKLLGVPPGTVRSRTHYAIKQLRERLGPAAEGGKEPWLKPGNRN
ncbi:MAG: RNA polymerase sigma factor [Firmicutes bacterium]|nr:RNA polymerase sigma factor [Bacillota bacterium]